MQAKIIVVNPLNENDRAQLFIQDSSKNEGAAVAADYLAKLLVADINSQGQGQSPAKQSPAKQTLTLEDILKGIDETFWVDVTNSDAVTRIGYDFSSNTMQVEFVGNLIPYTFYDVPVNTFLNFVKADSRGHFFHQFIKGKF